MKSQLKTSGILSPHLFLAALIYTTFAYGGTTPGTRIVCDFLLVVVVASYLIESRIRLSDGFKGEQSIIWIVSIIGLIACISIANPSFRYNEKLDFLESLNHGITWLPTTYDRATSWPLVFHFLALGGTLIILIDAASNREFRWEAIRAIALVGFVVASIGVLQKVTDARSLLFSSTEYETDTFFASFRYHGNAAAYLNLCWPASLAMLLKTIRRSRSNFLIVALWANAFLFTLGATLVNTSKYGHLVFIPSMVFAVVAFRRGLPKLDGRLRRTTPVIIIIVVALFFVLALFSAETVATKWAEALSEGVSIKRRLWAYETAFEIFKNAPIWGHGLGSFGLLFPYFTIGFGTDLGGKWSYAHNDYLQALVEWGIAGSILIFYVFARALFNLVKRQFSRQSISLSTTACLVALVLVLAHSFVDFPLQIPAIQLIVVFYLAVGLSEFTPGDKGRTRKPLRKRTRVRLSSSGSR